MVFAVQAVEQSSGLGWLDLVLRYPSRLSKNGEAVRFHIGTSFEIKTTTYAANNSKFVAWPLTLTFQLLAFLVVFVLLVA